MYERTCPLSGNDVLDEYFLEHRARLLDLAAFLDRIDRSQHADQARQDPRYMAFQAALAVLGDCPAGDRARRVQITFSDPTEEPIRGAAGATGAVGAWAGGER